MTRKFFVLILIFCLPVFFTACGGQKGETEDAAATEPKAEEATGDSGIDVAKEILAVFDKAAAEAVELVKEKPEVADVKPQFEALLEKYKEPMMELNAKYLGLRDKDIRLFGDCNGYLGENRGRHVMEMNTALDVYIAYYNYDKGEAEFSEYLSDGLINLLEIAVKR